jgi:hypothetical protein
VPEVNAHGLVLVNKLRTRYASVYRREVFDKTSQKTRQAIGWKTTPVSKPILVDDLEEAARTESIHIRSRRHSERDADFFADRQAVVLPAECVRGHLVVNGTRIRGPDTVMLDH